MRIKLRRLLSWLLRSPAAGCEREDRAAAPRGIGAEEIVAAFADAYGADLPIAIREGTWDYIAEPDLAAAVKVFAEATFVNRRAPRPEGLTREEYQALLRERVRHNAAIPQRTLYFQKAPPGEIRVAARHEDCYDGPWGMEGDMLVADVSPAPARSRRTRGGPQQGDGEASPTAGGSFKPVIRASGAHPGYCRNQGDLAFHAHPSISFGMLPRSATPPVDYPLPWGGGKSGFRLTLWLYALRLRDHSWNRDGRAPVFVCPRRPHEAHEGNP